FRQLLCSFAGFHQLLPVQIAAAYITKNQEEEDEREYAPANGNNRNHHYRFIGFSPDLLGLGYRTDFLARFKAVDNSAKAVHYQLIPLQQLQLPFPAQMHSYILFLLGSINNLCYVLHTGRGWRWWLSDEGSGFFFLTKYFLHYSFLLFGGDNSIRLRLR